ncbi:MAG TPA: GNAT family N-acetyltransferase [Phycisphaerales bacterium]|nr:GNAT family N-acetyltransferase [Phycisphaerales bacterium]
MAAETPNKPRFQEVRLRAIEPADLPALYEIQLDPEANALAMVIPRTWETYEPLMQNVLTNPAVVARAIIGDGALVGSISCFPRVEKNAAGKDEEQKWIGYWIAREHWGRGAATRALALLLPELEWRPLHARIASTNIASLRVLQRCGFVVTGRHHSPGTERFLECEEIELRFGS